MKSVVRMGTSRRPAAFTSNARSVVIANPSQTGFLGSSLSQSLLVVCMADYYGHVGEACLKCPSSADGRPMAKCPGYVATATTGVGANASTGTSYYPIPLAGFFDLNSTMAPQCPSSAVVSGRDVCIVACSPPEACAGANL